MWTGGSCAEIMLLILASPEFMSVMDTLDTLDTLDGIRAECIPNISMAKWSDNVFLIDFSIQTGGGGGGGWEGGSVPL